MELTELPKCTVCLERMDESVNGILTTLCNHSFHSQCLQRWEDASWVVQTHKRTLPCCLVFPTSCYLLPCVKSPALPLPVIYSTWYLLSRVTFGRNMWKTLVKFVFFQSIFLKTSLFLTYFLPGNLFHRPALGLPLSVTLLQCICNSLEMYFKYRTDLQP